MSSFVEPAASDEITPTSTLGSVDGAASVVASATPQPSSSASLPSCAQTCVSAFVATGCTSGSNCLCGNSDAIATGVDCICGACNASDQQEAIAFFKNGCNLSDNSFPSSCAANSSKSSTLATSTTKRTGSASSTVTGGVSGSSQSASVASHRGLSSGAYAGIGIGVALVVLLVIGLLILFFRRHVQISWKTPKKSNVMEIEPVGGASDKEVGSPTKDNTVYEIKHIPDEETNIKTTRNETVNYEIKHGDEPNPVGISQQTQNMPAEADGLSPINITKQGADAGQVSNEGGEMETNSNRYEAQGREVPTARGEFSTNANSHELRG